MTPSQFRLATPDDVDRILDLQRQLYHDDPGAPAPDANATRRAIIQLLSDSTLGQIWLACADQSTIGYLVLTFAFSLEFGGRTAFIDEVVVDCDHRNRGTGRSLLAWAVEQARSANIQAVHLEVARANARARKLYLSLGYLDHDRALLTLRLTPRSATASPADS